MYPIILEIGPLTIYSFGVMMAAGFFVAAWVSVREWGRRGGDEDHMWNYLVWVFMAGLAGSKILSLTNDLEGFFAHPLEQISSGSGFVWYGGLGGGALVAYVLARRHKMNFGSVLECTALGLPIGQALGRIGCHVGGDGDWGTVSELPWAVAYRNAIIGWDYAEGIRVHPTPLYEAAAYTAVFLFAYRLRKRGYPNGTLFAIYLVGASAARFLVEFIRINPRVAYGLTQAQLIAIVLFLGAFVWLLRHRSDIASASRASA